MAHSHVHRADMKVWQGCVWELNFHGYGKVGQSQDQGQMSQDCYIFIL